VLPDEKYDRTFGIKVKEGWGGVIIIFFKKLPTFIFIGMLDEI
jgi:hypothetical protein